MYRWILTSAVLLWFAAAPAVADVNVKVDYTKTKDVTVTETITIDKTITVDVTVDQEYERAAEAEALINQENNSNKACTNCAEKRDRIIGSVNDNSGVVSVNQSVGNMNNQATAVALSVDRQSVPPSTPPDLNKPDEAFANAQAAVEQDNGGAPCDDCGAPAGTVDQGPEHGCWNGNIQDSTNIEEKSAVISDSLAGNEGVANLNQASGNMANQANSLAMAVGFGEGGSALAEADLGQSNMFNMVLESQSLNSDTGANKYVRIDGSILQNSGIVGVNQTSGYMANQANVTAFAVVVAGQTPTP